MVLAMAFSKVKNIHDAQDTAQEVFTRVFTRLNTVSRSKRFQICDWIFTQVWFWIPIYCGDMRYSNSKQGQNANQTNHSNQRQNSLCGSRRSVYRTTKRWWTWHFRRGRTHRENRNRYRNHRLGRRHRAV
ncbi:TPA: hypothetical protein EYN98_16765 [Candidatus Poribacteria bacterium]|nr:hypothetical protein [Candidatus Poribacteria bacterium]HIA67673.1 hypothetical protein [Candidatus Poribacteria bacterium]HIB87895.1 hypothetical protein [Candidatus Poribacteria bacterium]HIO77193.1 hypothetical protein [Candidatus Poribacteria bacterium]